MVAGNITSDPKQPGQRSKLRKIDIYIQGTHTVMISCSSVCFRSTAFEICFSVCVFEGEGGGVTDVTLPKLLPLRLGNKVSCLGDTRTSKLSHADNVSYQHNGTRYSCSRFWMDVKSIRRRVVSVRWHWDAVNVTCSDDQCHE